MKACILLALLTGCPTSKPELDTGSPADPADTDTDTDADTDSETTGEDADDWGGCEYIGTPLGADEVVASLGGTPNEFSANVSGVRRALFHWDAEGTDTPLDHTLTLDVTTATLWVGTWIEGDDGDDTGATLADEDTTTDEDTTDPGTDTTTDTTDPTTDTTDTTDTTTDTDWGECPEYMSMEGDWSFTTGDGAFAEDLRVAVRAGSIEVGRIDHELDYAELAGTWVPYDVDPTEWDELRVSWAANIGLSSDVGEVALFGSRTWDGDTGTTDTTATDTSSGGGDDGTGDDTTSTDDGTSTGVSEAFMGDMGRWPTP
jgi:hypothetical protein